MSTENPGNTNKDSPAENTDKKEKRIAASLKWCFTLNNFTNDEFKILKNEIEKICLDYRVQEEIGENGTSHLQGYIHSKTRIRPFEKFSNKRIHWEKARHPDEARAYCCKEDTATGNYILDTQEKIDVITPSGWMLDIIDIIGKKPDFRTIHWYWEENGNTGKSALTKYLCYKYDALSVSGKSNDCKYGIIKYHENKKKYPKIIIFDVPRTNIEYINYEAIESIKNGCFFSGKYESNQVIMNSPHIIIFANAEPNTSKLSEDRWHIVNIMNPLEENDCSTQRSTSSVQ